MIQGVQQPVSPSWEKFLHDQVQPMKTKGEAVREAALNVRWEQSDDYKGLKQGMQRRGSIPSQGGPQVQRQK